MSKDKKITVYSSPDCAYCYTVKGYLEDNGFEYEEINIYEDTQAYDKMVEISGQKNVPVTVIGDDVLIGWNKEKFKEALDI
jgi:NADH-dependent peroxiredoxin subunit F